MQTSGLTSSEAKKLLEVNGENEIKVHKTSALRILFKQIRSPLIYLLFLAFVISVAVGSRDDATIIGIIVVINTFLGFYQEYKANISYEKLLSLITSNSTVLRDGEKKSIPKKEIVPGDVVFLKLGDIVPADGIVFEQDSFKVNESTLTGEAEAVFKKTFENDEADKHVWVYAGTSVESGTATVLIKTTSKNTKLGQISTLTIKTKKKTIYEENVAELGSTLLGVGIVVLLVIFSTHILFKQTESFSEILLFTLAIAITIIPEALPVIVSLNLSVGARKLGEKGIIIKRPESLEDLGNVELICTDKTGTLTKNIMTVEDLEVNKEIDDPKKYFLYSALGSTDPLDESVLNYYSAQNMKIDKVFKDIPFDPVKKFSGRIFDDFEIYKGASEYILSICKKENYEKLLKEINDKAGKLRHLSFAVKMKNGEFKYLGTFYLEDPIKDTAVATVEKAKKLGVEIKIITGDSIGVSTDVAMKVGLTSNPEEIIHASHLHFDDEILLEEEVKKYKVFTRCDPVQKYKIINALQKIYFIGYLGDGINDAPSLKLANVSIVVDHSTDIAKESSDIILTKKSLKYIVDSIVEGRIIFENIEKYLRYTLIGNVGNFFTIGILSIFSDFLPMLPIQILISNLLTDFTSLSITTDNVDIEEIKRPERLDLREILKNSLQLGALSSVFDFAVFFIFRTFPVPLVQILWFGYSTLEELIVVISLRTNRFLTKSKPSRPLLISTVLGIVVTIILMIGNFSFFPAYNITVTEVLAIICIALICTLVTELVKLRISYVKGLVEMEEVKLVP